MAQHPAMPLWTDAYLGDTHHLSTLEHGAYLLLLMSMWRAGGSLPADDKLLARHCRLTAAQWRRASPQIMPFFTVEDGRIFQGRLTDELAAVRQKSKSQSSKAKARWLKNNDTGDAAASSEHSQTDASLTLTHKERTLVSDDTNDSASPVVGIRQALFSRGLKFLTDRSVPEKQARSVIGKWCGDHGDQAVFDAFVQAGRDPPVDPIPWITATLKAEDDRQSEIQQTDAVLKAFAEGRRFGDAADG